MKKLTLAAAAFVALTGSAIAADLPRLVLKHDDAFMVTDRRGDFPGVAEFGFYAGGTRFLNQLELRVASRRPLLLNATVSDDALQAVIELTNADVLDTERSAALHQRRLLIPGGLVWALSGVLLINRVTLQPDYVGHYLPSVILSGLGVALCLPQLSSAAVQGLPPQRFGSGSAVSQAVRNLGATLGVAAAVAFTAGLTSAGALAAFHHVWWLLVVSGVSVSLLTSRLPRRVANRATVPAVAEVLA